jgi:hypothetical protein
MQIVDPPFQIHLVITPRLAINSQHGVPLQLEETRPQQFWREVVQQIGELLLPILLCRLSYTEQSARPAMGRFSLLRPARSPVQ